MRKIVSSLIVVYDNFVEARTDRILNRR